MIWLPVALLIAAVPDAGTTEPSAAELIGASEDAILAEPPPLSTPKARDSWDFASAPKYLDLVTARFPLDEQERAMLFKNGFVVASRFRQHGYQDTFHELHTSQLPVFVSTDSVLHAVFRSHDEFLIDVEQGVLAPRIVDLVRKMHQALPAARALWPKEVVADVELYLRLARLIAVDEGLKATPAESAWLSRIVRARGAETMTLFGRQRRVDFTQYQPRGHYADERYGLQAYFRLVMWLSRLELNLKSNACASSHPGPAVLTAETPREVLVALALAELTERSGTLADWEHVDRAFAFLAGQREDVSFSQLASLRKEAGVTALTEPDAATRVITAIGDRFQRTVNLHLMPENRVVRPLPVIATALGPRITAEMQALGPLTFELEPVAWAAVLGHVRALEHAKPKPEDREKIEEAQRRLASTKFGTDLYATWLHALVAYGQPSPGVEPTFTTKPAWADLRVNTALVGFAQLRHNNLLYTAQPEGEGGCRIPEGWVEPSVATYDALQDFAKAGRATVVELEALAGKKRPLATAYFAGLEKTLAVLSTLSRQELANQPLSADAQRFLSMVVETWAVRNNYGRYSVTQHDGWYFDLLYRMEGGPSEGAALGSPELIADLHGQPGKIAYAGARSPELGFFVVDTGGAPRVMAGPVARGFALWGDRRQRFRDDDLAFDTDEHRFADAPWAVSYRAPSALRRLAVYQQDAVKWEVWSAAPTGQQDFGPGFFPERKDVPLAGPVTVRLRGEHGEELFHTTVKPRKGERLGFTVPPEWRKATRLLSFEVEGEVVEEEIRYREP